MINIELLAKLCKTAFAAGSKAVETYRKKKLSKEEKELLIAAVQTGEFLLLSVEQLPGTWVRTGSKDFLNHNDPAYAATYLEAFRSLCERGYIIYEGGKLFMLTGSGFKKSRQLAKNVEKK